MGLAVSGIFESLILRWRPTYATNQNFLSIICRRPIEQHSSEIFLNLFFNGLRKDIDAFCTTNNKNNRQRPVTKITRSTLCIGEPINYYYLTNNIWKKLLNAFIGEINSVCPKIQDIRWKSFFCIKIQINTCKLVSLFLEHARFDEFIVIALQ